MAEEILYYQSNFTGEQIDEALQFVDSLKELYDILTEDNPEEILKILVHRSGQILPEWMEVPNAEEVEI